jgi:hypothetical protein
MKQLLTLFKTPSWVLVLLFSGVITTVEIIHLHSVIDSWKNSWYDQQAPIFAGCMTSFGIVLCPFVLIFCIVRGLRGKW